jgi:hypothetical protein
MSVFAVSGVALGELHVVPAPGVVPVMDSTNAALPPVRPPEMRVIVHSK